MFFCGVHNDWQRSDKGEHFFLLLFVVGVVIVFMCDEFKPIFTVDADLKYYLNWSRHSKPYFRKYFMWI